MNSTYTESEIAQRAQALYDQQIRPHVEADHKGKFVVVEVNTGDYEMDREDIVALKRAEAKHPDGRFFILRVGFRTAYHMGGRIQAITPRTQIPAPEGAG